MPVMNPGRTILVVEDNPVNLELVVDLLTTAGFQVLTANTAEHGLQIAASRQPALVLMDISLPGTDGLEATRTLKSSPATAHIPVIALTAHAMAGDEEKARAAGCNGYVVKPINTRGFIKQIAAFLADAPVQPGHQSTS